jgi:hypothetical protein
MDGFGARHEGADRLHRPVPHPGGAPHGTTRGPVGVGPAIQAKGPNETARRNGDTWSERLSSGGQPGRRKVIVQSW